MVKISHGNRRQRYRLQPPSVWAPRFSIVVDGKRHTAAKVVDVNLNGVRVIFNTADKPILTAGTQVTTVIQAPGLDGWVDIASRVIFTMSHNNGLAVALAFVEPLDLGDRVTGDFFRVFNRREDERRRSTPGQGRISALVLNAAGEADGIIDLMLRDHSPKGIGFMVDPPTDAFLQHNDNAGLALPSPDQQEAVRPAQVRHRNTQGDSIHYGCTFFPTISELP